MMNLVIVLNLITASPDAKLPACFEIAPFILLLGESAVTRWAEKHGYTATQIDTMRRKCMMRGKQE